jgi:hypothetical protein
MQVWRGRVKNKPERLGAPLKCQWRLLGLPNYREFEGTEACVEREIELARTRELELKAASAAGEKTINSEYLLRQYPVKN